MLLLIGGRSVKTSSSGCLLGGTTCYEVTKISKGLPIFLMNLRDGQNHCLTYNISFTTVFLVIIVL